MLTRRLVLLHLITLLILILCACSSSQIERPIAEITQPPLSRPAASTPVPAPTRIEAYPDALLQFLNADPQHIHYLNEQLDAWRANRYEQTASNPGSSAAQQHLQFVDIDADGTEDIVVIIDAAPIDTVQGLLLVFTHAAQQTYHVASYTIPPKGITNYGSEIVTIEDVTGDTLPEIVVLSNSAGACTPFMTVTIAQWTNNKLQTILSEAQNEAKLTISDENSDGVKEITLTGGGSSCYAPLHRAHTSIYTWNGIQYQISKTYPDPVVSQHPYFKLIDGNERAEAEQYQDAISLYTEGLQTSPPWEKLGDTALNSKEGAALLLAILRFRLMTTQVIIGEIEQAQHTHSIISANDGIFTAWSDAFWQTYQQTKSITKACQAVMQVNLGGSYHEWSIPGYTAVDPTYNQRILCPQKYQ